MRESIIHNLFLHFVGGLWSCRSRSRSSWGPSLSLSLLQLQTGLGMDPWMGVLPAFFPSACHEGLPEGCQSLLMPYFGTSHLSWFDWWHRSGLPLCIASLVASCWLINGKKMISLCIFCFGKSGCLNYRLTMFQCSLYIYHNRPDKAGN